MAALHSEAVSGKTDIFVFSTMEFSLLDCWTSVQIYSANTHLTFGIYVLDSWKKNSFKT